MTDRQAKTRKLGRPSPQDQVKHACNIHQSFTPPWQKAMTELDNGTDELAIEQEDFEDVAPSGSLDDDDDDEEETFRRPRIWKDPAVVRRQVLSRYYLLSTLAVGMTLTCPRTFIWKDGSMDRPFFVVRLLMVYAATLLFLTFGLQGTNPGYLTSTVMQHLDDLERQEQPPVEEGQRCGKAATGDEKNEKVVPIKETEAPLNAEPSQEDSTQDRLALLGNDAYVPSPTRRPPCRHCPLMSPPPLRSHHCHKCHHHVATFDHHCDFIGTCIGEANHARFWLFLTLQGYGFFMCVHAVDSSPLGVFSRMFSAHAGEANSSWGVVLYVVACRVYLYPLATGAALIWTLHTFLACTNSTTLEFVKGPRHLEYLHPQTRLCDLPFSQRVDENILQWIRRDASWMGEWRPTLWRRPGPIIHDSEKWWEHPWQNKYWSCC